MIHRSPSPLWIAVCLLALSVSVDAQTITVQQPVVQTFGVNTVVTVPDQGGVLLGGVSSAADGSFNSGFSPYGSSIGSERTHGTAWAHVYIHDFEAMDAALLSAQRNRPSPASTFRTPLAARAARQLMDAHRAGQTRRTDFPEQIASQLVPRTPRSDSSLVISHGADHAEAPPPPVSLPAAGPVELRARTVSAKAGSVPYERFGRQPASPLVSSREPSSSTAASSRSTNSGESPAASRASR